MIICKGMCVDTGRVDGWARAFIAGKVMGEKIRSGSLLKSTAAPGYHSPPGSCATHSGLDPYASINNPPQTWSQAKLI